MNEHMRSAVQALQDAGVPVTLPRLGVMMALLQADRPLSAQSIHRLLVARSVDVAVSSTYVSLKKLVAAGLVVSQEHGAGAVSYKPAR